MPLKNKIFNIYLVFLGVHIGNVSLLQITFSYIKVKVFLDSFSYLFKCQQEKGAIRSSFPKVLQVPILQNTWPDSLESRFVTTRLKETYF